MEYIQDHRDFCLPLENEAVRKRIQPFIVLDNEPCPDCGRQAGVRFGKPGHACRFIAIYPANMDLDFCRRIKPHDVQDCSLVLKLGNAAGQDIRVRGVEEDKLVGVHGDPEPIVTAERPEPSEGAGNVVFPRERTDRVRGKRDKIGCDPEEEETVIRIIGKDLLKTGKIGINRIAEAFIVILGKTERP